MTEIGMTRRVYKYTVPIDDEDHQIPPNVVHVDMQDGKITVWCEVNGEDGRRLDTQAHRVFATGQPLPAWAFHRGTVIAPPFVWHLYNTHVEF